MKKLVLLAAAAVAMSGAMLPAGAATKKATDTYVATNGVAGVHAVSDESLTVNGPGKAILKKKVDGNWVTKHSEEIKFTENLAFFDSLVLGSKGDCKVVAKYLGNAKYAASTSKGWPVDCKTGAYNGPPA